MHISAPESGRTLRWQVLMDYDIFMAIVSIGFVAIYTPYVVIGTVFD